MAKQNTKNNYEELFRRLAVSYHWEYDADYPAEREEILEAWNNMVPAAVKAGMTHAQIAEIFKKEEADARAWKIRCEQEEDDALYR